MTIYLLFGFLTNSIIKFLYSVLQYCKIYFSNDLYNPDQSITLKSHCFLYWRNEMDRELRRLPLLWKWANFQNGNNPESLWLSLSKSEYFHSVTQYIILKNWSLVTKKDWTKTISTYHEQLNSSTHSRYSHKKRNSRELKPSHLDLSS